MSVNANEVDILNLRTTNINIRISPMLKLKIIESGARMGVNLSDYINYILTKMMSGQVDVENTPLYKKLENELSRLKLEVAESSQKVANRDKQNEALQKPLKTVQSELTKYEVIAEPYKQDVGKPITINGETFEPQHPADLLSLILKQFKVKR